MSSLLIPIIVVFVIFYGFFKGINVYDSFVSGASEGIGMIKGMFPSLLSMILAVNIFSNSGVITFVFGFLKPIFGLFNFPFEVLPIAALRPLSGSFGLASLSNLYRLFGPDSYISILASVIQGSSDTTIYIITLYFGTIGVKKIKYALWVGLLADLIMVILSIILVPILT